MKIKTFEDFLSDEHAKQYSGLDDDMVDNFDNWVANLGVDDVIEYANECIEQTIKEYQEKIKKGKICLKCGAEKEDDNSVFCNKCLKKNK